MDNKPGKVNLSLGSTVGPGGRAFLYASSPKKKDIVEYQPTQKIPTKLAVIKNLEKNIK